MTATLSQSASVPSETRANTAPEAVILVDTAGVVLAANRVAAAGLGKSLQELVGSNALDLVTPEVAAMRKTKLDKLVSSGDSASFVGSRLGRVLSDRVHPLMGRDGKVHMVMVFYRDITEELRAQEALRESELRFRTLIESSPEPILLDRAGVTLFANLAFARLVGADPVGALAGRSVLDFVAPGFREQVANHLVASSHKEGAPATLEVDGLREDGTVFASEVRVSQVDLADGPATLAYVRDITERRAQEARKAALEAQLQQAQKLESVGRLAGGIAHDFNNLLTAMTGNLELIMMDLSAGDPMLAQLAEVRRATDSAAGLTRQLLAFSRKQIIEPRAMDLNALLGRLEKMLRRLIGEDLRLELALAPNLGCVRADPGQMEQILVNLAVNARDAMPDGGTLRIETTNGQHSEAAGTDLARFVCVTVSDTGVGMTQEVKEHLFEPFFTTKDKDKGTGLGLATVYGMVQQNGGRVEVDSTPGMGSRFRIMFPEVREKAQPERASTVPEFQGQGETVLLVEDEVAVRDLARRFLGKLGYRVLEAGSGAEALAVARGHEGPIHLMLTDVVMPGMSGRALAGQLKVLRPETKTLFTSGYTEDAIAHHGVLEDGLAFLGKPYNLKALGAKLRQVLGQP